MASRNRLHSAFAAFLTVLVVFATTCSTAEAAKKVRVTNNTGDTGIRAHVIHYNPQIKIVTDVPRDQQKLFEGVTPGFRGVVIYEDLNEKVITTGSFKLEQNGDNIDVIVTGDAANGYNLSFAVFND